MAFDYDEALAVVLEGEDGRPFIVELAGILICRDWLMRAGFHIK